MDVIRSCALTETLLGGSENQGDEKEDGMITEETDDYLCKLLTLTQNAVRQANAIPTGTTYSIQTSNVHHSKKATKVSSSIMTELFNILSIICPEELAKEPLKVATPEALSKNYEKFVDCMELLLSKVDKGINAFTTGNPSVLMGSLLASEKETKNEKGTISLKSNKVDVDLCKSLERPKSLLRSNLELASYWKYTRVDAGRFVPTLTIKPHAITPLDDIFYEAQQQVTTLKTQKPSFQTIPLPALPHPYAHEIMSLNFEDKTRPEGKVRPFELRDPKIYNSVDSTPLVWVRTVSELREMIQEIRDNKEKEIAIDVEHHSQRSYRGVTCLIQISTRRKDFLIDPVDLQDELVQLNEVTCDPRIVKVLHGSDSDVIWLQRDFSIYVVNLFDTGQAARLIELPGGASLANLLMYYCKIATDKRFQLADWRVRPLTDEMVNYARSDTHYLLYVYDKIRTDVLTSKSLNRGKNEETEKTSLVVTEDGIRQMRFLLECCRNISLTVYREEPVDYVSVASNLIKRYRVPLAPKAFTILKGLLEWRELLAKARDENPSFTCNSPVLLRIATTMPRTWSELQSLANPLPRVIQEKAMEILEVVKKGMDNIEVPSQVQKMEDTKLNHHITATTSTISGSNTLPEPGNENTISPEDENYESTSQTLSCPQVIVSVSSSVRKKDSSRSSMHRTASLPADAFEVMLAEDESESLQKAVVGCEGPLQDTAAVKSLGVAGSFRHGKLFARVVSSLISRDFTRVPTTILSSLSQNRPRKEVAQSASESKFTAQIPEAKDKSTETMRFSTNCEILVDKVGGRRKKRKGKSLLMFCPDVEEVSSIVPFESSTSEPLLKRRKTNQGKDNKLPKTSLEADVLSEAVKTTPSREWKRKRETLPPCDQFLLSSGKKREATPISDTVLEKVKDILPAGFISQKTKSDVGHTLMSLPNPKFFGTSAVTPSKPKTTTRKRKKKSPR